MMVGKTRFLVFAAALCCLLGACGTNEEKQTECQWIYKARETAFPDWQSDLRQTGLVQEEPGRVNCILRETAQGSACQVLQLQYNNDMGDTASGTVKGDEYCLQWWDGETSSWKCERILATEWISGCESEISLVPIKAAAGNNGEYYFLFCLCREEEEYYLGVRRADGSREILKSLSAQDAETAAAISGGDGGLFVSQDGAFYLYSVKENMVLRIGGGEEASKRYDVQGAVLGMMQNKSDQKIYWYGYDAQGAMVCPLDGQQTAVRVDALDPSGFRAAFSGDGNLYLTDLQSVWISEQGKEPQQIWKWNEQGYNLERISGFAPAGENEVSLWTYYEGSDQLVTLCRTWEVPTEKQEVVLAVSVYPGQSALRQAIEAFNRQSTTTKIIVRSMDDQGGAGSFSEYVKEIQMEVSAGEGPDLIAGDLLDMEAYAKNGYLLSLDEKLDEMDDVLPAARDYVKYDGEVFGVPYRLSLNVLICSSKTAGLESGWSVDEMMKAVENSGAEILQGGLDGSGIIFWFGLFDGSNKAYIDWENGESHLTEEPFLKLMEFAKKYRDLKSLNEYEGLSECLELLKNGRAAVYGAGFASSDLDSVMRNYNMLQDDASFVGLPSTEGSGVYVAADYISVNSLSDNTQGCLEFLEYLLSKEAQTKMSRYEMSFAKQGAVGQSLDGTTPFCVRTDILKEQLAGFVKDEKLTQEQGNMFLQMMLNAEPWISPARQIETIVLEELEGYFSGDMTDRETAEKLDRRVQLYLDENS